jgi:hypothetical protein
VSISQSNAIFDSKFIDCSEGPLLSFVYTAAICRRTIAVASRASKQRGQGDDVFHQDSLLAADPYPVAAD